MNRFQRRQIRLKHQRGLAKELGIIHTLEQQGERIIEMAGLEPIVRGYPKDSQTKIVMELLETYGAEGARL
jgi:hypothetical protein